MSRETLTTFLFEAANFVALAGALAWLFFKPVRRALESQRAKMKQQEEEAAKKLAEAETLRDQISNQREMLGAELEQMRAKTRDLAKEQAAAVVTEARTQMERERETLRHEAVSIQRAQTSKLARAVAAATQATVRRLLQQMAGPELEQMLVTAACRELARFANNSSSAVTVETASALDETSKAEIEAALGRAKKRANFRVVPELVTGLRITTEEGLIDASVSGLASFAEQFLNTEIDRMLSEESMD